MENTENRTKCIASFQLEKFMLDWLKKKAREECTTISYLIRKMVLKTMREEGEND